MLSVVKSNKIMTQRFYGTFNIFGYRLEVWIVVAAQKYSHDSATLFFGQNN